MIEVLYFSLILDAHGFTVEQNSYNAFEDCTKYIEYRITTESKNWHYYCLDDVRIYEYSYDSIQNVINVNVSFK